MAHRDHVVIEAVKRLDTGDFAVTPWEASFLESLLRRTYPASSKQRAVLARLVERYLHDEALSAELLGQQRLL